ncbi:MAG TPA: MFS transporter [Pseudomonadales bacterium]
MWPKALSARSLPALADSRRLRLSAFTLFYLAQGIPLGLLDLAMPAWLAAEGYTAVQVGTYVATIGLPWAFKLIAGPFMDRFGFPPMGRRRPWVMFAQTGLMVMLALLAFVHDPATQLVLIAIAGVLVNSFAAAQDVAVDGMAIDVLPVEERGRANAFMAFGQVAGVAGMGAISGMLLARFGLLFTGLFASLLVAVILMMVIACRERQGERLLPWSQGDAHPSAAALSSSLTGLFGDLRRAVLLPMSLVLSGAAFTVRAAMGMFIACAPVFAVQELGYSSETYSQTYGTLIGVCAVAGLAIGPLVDRLGVRRIFVAALCAGALMTLSFSLLTELWSVHRLLLAMLVCYLLVEQIIFICLIAQYMNLTWQQVAATQFAVYMALSNLGRSVGSGLFAALSVEVDYERVFQAVGLLYLVALCCALLFNEKRHQQDLDRLAGRMGT